MRILPSTLISFCLFLSTLTSYALPFTIVSKAGTQLPTTVLQGSAVTAYYTVTNNTQAQRKGNFVKYLPPNVAQISANGTYPDICGSPFDLAGKGQAQSSCTLQLAVTGPVNGADPDPHHHLFACFSGGTSCAGTSNPLNVVQAALVSIAITPLSEAHPRPIMHGRTQQMTVTGTYYDGSTQNISSLVTWSSSNSHAASIDTSGLVKSLDTGSTIITATLDNAIKDFATLNVQRFAYLVDIITNQKPIYCVISTDGTLSQCKRTGNINVTNFGYFGIAINPAVTYAYLTDYTNQSVNYCVINDDATLGDCNTAISTNSVSEIRINPAGTYVYIASTENGTILYCSTKSDGNLDNCHSTGSNLPSSLSDIAINPAGTYVYLTNSDLNNIYACPVEPDGSLGVCQIITHDITGPTALAFNPSGSYVYISHTLENGLSDTYAVSYCFVNDDVTFSHCTVTGEHVPPEKLMSGITINAFNTYAYLVTPFVSSLNPLIGDVYTCSISSNGSLGNCHSNDLGYDHVYPYKIAVP